MLKTAGSSLLRFSLAAMLAVFLVALPALPAMPAWAAELDGPILSDGAFADATADALQGITVKAKKAVKKVEADAVEAATVERARDKARKESSATEYCIAVDLTEHRTIVFKWKGDDWRVVKNWICSTGAPESPTVTGSYEVVGYGDSFSKDGYTCYYYTQFFGNYLFHSVKYHEGTFDIEDGRLGKSISEGCVRLDIKNAKWLHDKIPMGTRVIIYE